MRTRTWGIGSHENAIPQIYFQANFVKFYRTLVLFLPIFTKCLGAPDTYLKLSTSILHHGELALGGLISMGQKK